MSDSSVLIPVVGELLIPGTPINWKIPPLQNNTAPSQMVYYCLCPTCLRLQLKRKERINQETHHALTPCRSCYMKGRRHRNPTYIEGEIWKTPSGWRCKEQGKIKKLPLKRMNEAHALEKIQPHERFRKVINGVLCPTLAKDNGSEQSSSLKPPGPNLSNLLQEILDIQPNAPSVQESCSNPQAPLKRTTPESGTSQ